VVALIVLGLFPGITEFSFNLFTPETVGASG
jgi:hypothetical protein